MRWLKHMTDTTSDEKIAQLIGTYGPAAYGEYWMVVEIVAKHVDKTDKCSATYPMSVWAHKLFTRGSLVMSKLSRLALTGVLTIHRHELDITVTIPNLLKYRDEYSSRVGTKSRACPEQEADTEAEADTEKKSVAKATPKEAPPARSTTAWRDESFDRFWGIVWMRKGRLAAKKAWDKRATSPTVAQEIIDGAGRLGLSILNHAKVHRHSVIHPATWINAGGWMDQEESLPLYQSEGEVRRSIRKALAVAEADPMLLWSNGAAATCSQCFDTGYLDPAHTQSCSCQGREVTH